MIAAVCSGLTSASGHQVFQSRCGNTQLLIEGTAHVLVVVADGCVTNDRQYHVPCSCSSFYGGSNGGSNFSLNILSSLLRRLDLYTITLKVYYCIKNLQLLFKRTSTITSQLFACTFLLPRNWETKQNLYCHIPF